MTATDYQPRPPVLVQEGAQLPPATPAEAFAFAVDVVISAWAYYLTSSGRPDRADALELLGAAMDGLLEARQRHDAGPIRDLR